MNGYEPIIDLIEKSMNNCQRFIEREKRSLVTFTGDSSLIYNPDPEREKFHLDVSSGNLFLPLVSFVEDELDENQIMWHIYYELSLYSDWRKNTKIYLDRKIAWKYEIDFMTKYILDKVERVGLDKDKAYSEEVIYAYVTREILDSLFIIDRYYGFLRVLQLCPIYRDPENYEKIVNYMVGQKKNQEEIYEMAKHKAFIRSFLTYDLGKNVPRISNLEENPFDLIIFNKPILLFVHDELIRQINKGQGIEKRDKFVKSFIYPTYKRLWMEEIDEILLYRSKKGEGQSPTGQGDFSSQDETIESTMDLSQDDVEIILEDMMEEENERLTNVKESLDGKLDLIPYGVSRSEQELFNYYENKMRSQREQMKNFWERLIGDAKKEVNVKHGGQIRGKLDVDSFINFYPEFIEAEKKGNYKDLEIFNRYLLERQAKLLPSRIEVSFLIDNSGSMNPLKLEEARKTLAVTLLSLEDFNNYLEKNTDKLRQKVSLVSETWFFASGYYRVKEFDSEKNLEKARADIVKSIVKLDASGGATDDGACLREIADSISPAKERELKIGDQVKIVFEITDGASSFPGASKEAVEDLLSKNVIVYSFQIGKNKEMTEKIFNYIWNDGYRDQHGIILGESIESLPNELVKIVKSSMEAIFKK